MKENEILEETIDRYLNGLMTDEETTAFNARLQNDSELHKEVELQRSIIKAVRKEQLGKIIQKEERRIIKQKGIRKLVISIGSFALAASVLGFFYVGYLNNCEDLANRYYAEYTYSPIPTRGDETLPLTKSDSIFFNALQELEKGNNKLAISRLEELNNSSSEMIAASESDSNLYNASKEMEKMNSKLAFPPLEDSNNSSSEMIAASGHAIKWYLALARLKNGEKKKAKVLLREIESSPNNEYSEKAKELLQELK